MIVKHLQYRPQIDIKTVRIISYHDDTITILVNNHRQCSRYWQQQTFSFSFNHCWLQCQHSALHGPSYTGATTLGIITLSIMTLSIMTLGIMTLSIMTFGMMTLGIITLKAYAQCHNAELLLC